MAFPLWQIVQSSHVFYTNALDEGSYLQYDYAKLVVEIAAGARGAQWIVPKLHEFGLSGGAINLLFDFICFPLTCVLLCRRLGTWRALSTIGVLPLFTCFNPLIDWCSTKLISSSLLAWASMPFSSDHPLLRTPEPQFTYALAAISPYLALPFAYPFVGLAALCACVAYPLRKRRFAILFGVLTTLLVATVAAKLLLNPTLAGYAAFSRAPLLSCSATLAVLLLWISRKRFAPSELYVLKCLAIGLLVAQNQQIVSGFLIQPSNFEQYFGAPLCAYLCARSLEFYLPNFKTVVLLAASSIFALQLLEIMQRNHYLLVDATLDRAIIEQATQDPRNLIQFDIHIATRLNLVAAKQAPTLLSITAGYSLLADRFIQQYRYAKAKLMPIDDPILQNTLRTLDAIYSFDNRTAPLNTIGRRSDFGAARDTSTININSTPVPSDGK